MENEEYWKALKDDSFNNFADHDAVIDYLVSQAGDDISKETIAQAKKGKVWGDYSN
jgi:hypothetical protein